MNNTGRRLNGDFITGTMTDQTLTDRGIIYNKRGIGYFVSPDARETILEAQRADFLEREVPAIKRKMELLGLDAKIFN